MIEKKPNAAVSNVVYEIIIEEPDDIEEIEAEEGAPAWMVIFADLMTLLLVFFVLLFAISKVETSKFEEAMNSMKKALSVEVVRVTTKKESIPKSETEPMPESLNISEETIEDDNTLSDFLSVDDILTDINEIINRKHLGDFIVVEELTDRIIIRIEGKAIFDVGNVVMLDDAEPVIDDIINLLHKHNGFDISIKGHTDNIPIETTAFPSNWELSAVRATTVLRYFIEQGVDPGRLTATGYADRLPIATNDTAQGRAKNRRVEFVLEKYRK